jgi:hypothetical protein
MPYAAEISRTNPTCFLFLVDQSGSMSKPFAGPAGKTKSQGVADAINRLLQNLVLKSTKSEGTRDYFYVGVIGYGAEIGSAFGGALAGQKLVPISEIANKPLRLEERSKKLDDGAGGIDEQKIRFPVWFEPKAEGKTSMCRALAVARESISEFLKQFPFCYPPVVINITDGRATDGSPDPPAAALTSLASKDGNVLLFNACLSSCQAQAIEFPDAEDSLPDDYARILFRMSSLLPVKSHAAARAEGFRVTDATRGFVFNADLVSVIRFIDIGTKATEQAPVLPEWWAAIAKPSERARSGWHCQPTAAPARQTQLATSEPDVFATDSLAISPGKTRAGMVALLASLVITLPLIYFFLPAFYPMTAILQATDPHPKLPPVPVEKLPAPQGEADNPPGPEADPHPECELVRKWLKAHDPDLTIVEWEVPKDLEIRQLRGRVSFEATVQRGKDGKRQTLRCYIINGEIIGKPVLEDKE